MKPLKGYNNAQASGEFERLAPGGYVIRIQNVKDDKKMGEAENSMLRIVYDIAEGPEAGRYKNEPAENDYRHQFVRSYKEKALGMFKAFIMAVDESNGSNLSQKVEDGLNEQLLVGKIVGAVFGYEEYEANDGNIKERLYLKSCMSADRIRKSEFKVPELKKLKQGSGSTTPAPMPEGFTPMTDDDLPF